MTANSNIFIESVTKRALCAGSLTNNITIPKYVAYKRSD